MLSRTFPWNSCRNCRNAFAFWFSAWGIQVKAFVSTLLLEENLLARTQGSVHPVSNSTPFLYQKLLPKKPGWLVPNFLILWVSYIIQADKFQLQKHTTWTTFINNIQVCTKNGYLEQEVLESRLMNSDFFVFARSPFPAHCLLFLIF